MIRQITRIFPLLCIALATASPSWAQQATRPPATELMLWARADDLLTFYKDGDRIGEWPDASGKKRHLTSNGEQRPFLKDKAIHEHAAVQFKGDLRADPKVNHAFNIPLAGEWRGITVFVVGTNMAGPGIFDSAPGSAGCLRTMGWMQLTGTKAGADKPFPLITNATDPALITIATNIDDKGALTLSTFANGQAQIVSVDDNPLFSVILRNGRIGNNNGGENVFNGEIAEVLIYRGQLTEDDRRMTELYLMGKYALGAARPEYPEFPAGFTPPKDPEAEPLAAVTGKPAETGMALWLRADDLFGKGIMEGAPISELPNAAGDRQPLTSSEQLRPKYAPAALNNRPVLKFEGNAAANPKVVQYLTVPIEGEYPEVTFVVAGRGLNRAGVIDTAPGQNHCFRTMGWMQLTGSKFSPGQPFPLLQFQREEQMITIIIGKLGENGQYLETYANGHLQFRQEVADEVTPVLFRNATIGTNNLGESQFNGEIGEFLIYTRALNEAERKQTDSYLSEKWGIPIKTKEQIEAEMTARSHWTTKATQLPRAFSWFGNSFSGKTEWVQSGVSGITALPDGTVIATSIWDEPHKEIGFYKDGKPVGPKISGGSCKVTFDDQYLYVGLSGMGKTQAGVRRLTREGVDAPWPEYGNAKWPMFDTPAIWNEVQGIAVSKTELFVTCTGLKEIRVYDIASGAFKRSLPIDAPGALVIDKDGLLWLGNDALTQYAPDGKATGKRVTGLKVGALAFDPQGRLVVAESGARQQLIAFDISGAQPREVSALLQRGGVWAQERYSQFADDRIMNPNGLGIDAAGNLYVNGAGIISSFTPAGQLRWRIFSTVFCTASDFDPATDGNDLYSRGFHYRYQPGQPAGNDWQLFAAMTDPARFPEPFGSSQSNLLRRLNGRLYQFAIGTGVYVTMKDEQSSVFAPVAMYTGQGNKGGQFRPNAAPEKGRFVWSDANGNGVADAGEFTVPAEGAFEFNGEFYSYGIDERGGLWEPLDRHGVRHTPIREFTAQGAPVYDLQNQTLYPRPAEFSEILRSYYYADTDTMYLAGYTWDFPSLGNEHWGNCGREVVVYEKWSTPDARTIRARIPYPDGLVNVKAISILDSADLLFVGEMETSVIFIYNTRSGKLLGIVEPDPEIVGMVGWIDIGEGIRAFRRQNGEILLLVEDSWAQKEMVYRIPAAINE